MRKPMTLCALAALVALSACSSNPTPSPKLTETTTAEAGLQTTSAPSKEGTLPQWSSLPPMTINQDREYMATIKTNFGEIVVRLFAEDAPLAVNNFVFLARQGFYDGVKFHRVVKGFVIQSGDPTGTGAGGPGYEFADERVTKDYVSGTLAMANHGPNTNGSQFFITLADLSGRLPKSYTIFGQVTSGFDVIQEIGNVPVKAKVSGGEVSSPMTDVHIDSIAIKEG